MMRRFAPIILLAGTALLVVRAEGTKAFATPEKARDGLIEAAQKGMDEVRALFGPNSTDIVRTGDEVADKNVLARFNLLASEKMQLEPEAMNPNRITLRVGLVEWPFAVPLTRKDGFWFWDVE
jgi:Protein of unknown function (DUF2950)